MRWVETREDGGAVVALCGFFTYVTALLLLDEWNTNYGLRWRLDEWEDGRTVMVLLLLDNDVTKHEPDGY